MKNFTKFLLMSLVITSCANVQYRPISQYKGNTSVKIVNFTYLEAEKDNLKPNEIIAINSDNDQNKTPIKLSFNVANSFTYAIRSELDNGGFEETAEQAKFLLSGEIIKFTVIESLSAKEFKMKVMFNLKDNISKKNLATVIATVTNQITILNNVKKAINSMYSNAYDIFISNDNIAKLLGAKK